MAVPGGYRRYLLPIGLGAASAVLYGTVFMAPAFLLPIQASGARRGYRAMAVSAAVAAAAIAGLQLALLGRAGSVGAAMVLMGVVPPVALLATLALMALPALRAVPFALRALGGGLAASLATLPGLALAARDPQIRALFDEAAARATQALGAQAIDAAALWDTLSAATASSFGAVIFLFLFASALSGTRFGLLPTARQPEPGAVPAADAAALPPPLGAYTVPQGLVWLLLASWSAILLTRLVPSPALNATAWNVAIALSICYALQGLAVSVALAGRIGMASVARAFGPIVVVLLLVSGTAGLVALGLFALLGTLETWIPFRNVPKGELP